MEVLRDLVRELRPGSADAIQVSPSSRLDRDLGLDSLARVELWSRVEARMGLRVPDRLLAEAETVGDLLAAVGSTQERGSDQAEPSAPKGGPSGAPPAPTMPISEDQVPQPIGATTLIDILRHFRTLKGDTTHIWFHDDEGEIHEISFEDVVVGAEDLARGLIADGVTPGAAISIMLPTGPGFLDAFFGVLMAGCTPVPMYPPVRPSQIEEHMRRQAIILETARVPLMITVPEARTLGRFLEAQVKPLRRLATPEELVEEGRKNERIPLPPLDPESTAFLQFTSGSTGNPKGVVLTHSNLLANIRAIVGVVQPTVKDVFVSWLPLYHDLGLIGAVLSTMYAGVPLVLMSPIRFLTRPERWLQAISDYQGTMSAAPNFAYALCNKRIPEEVREKLDLSTWRFTLNGAEPVVPETLREFEELFGPQGFRPEVMQPVYGLAENSVGVTRPMLGKVPRIDRIQREPFSAEGRAVPADPEDENALVFVGCGTALPNHEMRVVDESGRELPDRREGRVHFKGPSATSGYFENPEATAQLLVGDGWLDSGDLGYMLDGEIYVTGRRKDVIIRGGRNIYPHELEDVVGELGGIRKGCVAVFAAKDEAGSTEKVVVLAETREKDEAERARMRQEILALSTEVLGSPADDVVLAGPGTVLKTSSGKLRRAACRDRYEAGVLEKGPTAMWLQMTRLALSAGVSKIRSWVTGLGELAWAAWWWWSFCSGCLLVMAGVAVLPTHGSRWRFVGIVARLTFLVTGVRIDVEGGEHLDPPGGALYVSNHTSYMDSLVHCAVLPAGAVFVAKREMERTPLIGRTMRRLGCVFVDRHEDARPEEAANDLRTRVEGGSRVLIYPEGTCLRQAGLLPFHNGAFVVAAQAGCPVVPVALHGVRELLRAETTFARRARVQVRVGPPMGPEGDDWKAAVGLRDRVRSWILEASGEPDLEHEDVARFFE